MPPLVVGCVRDWEDTAMSDSATPVQKTREPHRRFAERHGVSTKTIDRWVEAKILPPPDRIRNRKYWDPNTEPRHDDGGTAK